MTCHGSGAIFRTDNLRYQAESNDSKTSTSGIHAVGDKEKNLTGARKHKKDHGQDNKQIS